MKVSIGNKMQIASGQNGKWDKNPPKDKGTLAEKKSQDVAKVRCFNCEELGHFSKDYKKIKQDWSQGGFIAKANVAKLGPNSTMLRFNVGTNGLLCLLDSRATHLFVNPSAVARFKWVVTKVAKPIRVRLAQGITTPTCKVVFEAILECGKVKFTKHFTI
jgi:hypothetical protein